MKKLFSLILTIFIIASLFSQEKEVKKESVFQLSFITPLGTNGWDSYLYANTFSLNILGGYSYANTVLELGGLYNFNSEYTSGFQGAGLLNYTGRGENVFQFAGLANLSAGGNSTLQFAGIGNLANSITGLQGATIVNIADTVKGIQVSGVINMATIVEGFQGSPFFNIAETVKGVQLGLINYAQEIEGVQLGLINIVEKGGKKELELSFSDTLNAVISFKLGTDYFYTIFSNGTHFLNYRFEYAPGMGIGTQFTWNKGWSNQIEAMVYQLTEDTIFTTPVNMLTQVKLLTSKTIVGGLNFFAGPTANMTITQLKDDNGDFYSSIAPWTMWENNSDSTKLRFWVGFSAGLTYLF